eukprot:s2160_g4.t1
MFQKNVTTGAWRWVDASWSNDWQPQTSHSAPYHCSMCSSEGGKGKAAEGGKFFSGARDEPRGWTWEEAEEFAKPCSGMMSLEPFSVDTVKGWTRISCVALIALAVSELDVTDDHIKAVLERVHRAREKMMQHLSFTKWKDSAFSTEQLRTVRWLLGAKPRGIPGDLADILTVTAQAQSMLVELHIKCFSEATRRLKISAWSRKRASAEEFDKLVDFACMFSHLRVEARKVNSDASVDSKLESGADVLAAQEQASASRFNEVKVRLAADCQAMNQFNVEKNKVAGKQHVAKVMHEKTQLAAGKTTLETLVVDDFMQNNCWCGLVPEMEMPAEVDTILRATAARNQVSADQVLIVGWVDLTKIGVLGQKDVNKVALWCEKLVAKNPTGFLTELDSSLFCLASVGVLPRPYLNSFSSS